MACTIHSSCLHTIIEICVLCLSQIVELTVSRLAVTPQVVVRRSPLRSLPVSTAHTHIGRRTNDENRSDGMIPFIRSAPNGAPKCDADTGDALPGWTS